MADNSPQGGTDTIRDIDNSLYTTSTPAAAKTQVFKLDGGGQTGEVLINADTYNNVGYIHTDPSTAGSDGAIYNPVTVPQVDVVAGRGTDNLIHPISVDSGGNQNVNLLQGQTTDVPIFNSISGDPNGDFAGLNLIEEVISGNNGLNFHVNVDNNPRQDANGSLILSDAVLPLGQRIVGVVGQIFIIDTAGYQIIHASSGPMAANITGSNDLGGTFQSINCWSINSASQAPATTLAANSNMVIPASCRYIKLTVTTAGWATYHLRQGTATPLTQGSTPSNLFYVNGTAISNTTAGLLDFNIKNYNNAAVAYTNPMFASLVALASTNGQTLGQSIITATAAAVVQIKASAGKLTMLQFSNAAAFAGYFHLQNNAAATTSTASVQTYTIPASVGNWPIQLPDGGLYLSTGIAFTVSGAIASGDTTALTTPSMAVNYSYI